MSQTSKIIVVVIGCILAWPLMAQDDPRRAGGQLGGGDGTRPPVRPSDQLESKTCAELGDGWFNTVAGSAPVRTGAPLKHVIIHTTEGRICYRKAQTRRIDGGTSEIARVTQGDLLYFGLYGLPSKLSELRQQIDTCSLQPSAPQVFDGGTLGIEEQAGDGDEVPELLKMPPVECFDDTIEVKYLESGNTTAFAQKIRQYKRYQATWQVGVLWTDLMEPSYTVTDLGDGPIIRNTEAGSRGPEYMGSLVVYGIPHHLRSLIDGQPGRYAGRDIVNENRWDDRLGLFLSFGLSDPDETIGIGLSFEIANGINITATQLFRKLPRLDGVAEGDAFTLGADQIPIRDDWDDELVIGLSIDGRFLTKFFGSGD